MISPQPGRAALAPYDAQLDALLGPQLAAAYRRTASRKFLAGDARP